MIELKSNPDYLHRLAHDTRESGHTETAEDLDGAAHDIKNLRDYGWTLEKTLNETSAEIQQWKDKAAEMEMRAQAREENYNAVCEQRDAAAAALLAIIRPQLEILIDELLDYNRPLENLRERVEALEDMNDDDKAEDIRREVRDMIADGEIIVTIDTN